MRQGGSVALLLSALLGAAAGPASAQHHPAGHERASSWSVGALAVPLLTHATPALYGESLTEGYLSQPAVMAHAGLWGGRLELSGMLNFEGLTLERGELNPGIWGEGYVDRRHPHTYLHEAMATLRVGERRGASLAVGRGFVPFGTDDPMTRPMVKYPANHHFAQILERTVAVAAVRGGPLVLEVGAFNGDEPAGPEALPGLDRFGDSWAARATLLPLAGVEVQGSYAFVSSPEHAGGLGLDQRKWSASGRFEGPLGAGGRRLYGLLEWARTQEYDDGRPTFAFQSVLGEGALSSGAGELALRYERTERPEEERLLDPFRTQQPHLDVHLLGITRWDIATVRASREVGGPGTLRLRPFVEASRSRATETLLPSFFVPSEFYGSDRMWSLSLGMRVELGVVHGRMGRYGVAAVQ